MHFLRAPVALKGAGAPVFRLNKRLQDKNYVLQSAVPNTVGRRYAKKNPEAIKLPDFISIRN